MNDYLVRAIAKEGGVRGFVCITTDLVNEAGQRHQTSAAATVALGRALTGAALMGALLKVQQRVALKFEGNGLAQKILAEADSYGRVRGLIGVPDIDLTADENGYDLVQIIGRAGLLTVVKDLRLKQLQESMIPLAASDFSQDLQAYFEQSEQLPTVVQIGEVLDDDGRVLFAGGMLLQAVPTEEPTQLMAQLQERLQELPPVINLLHEGKTPEAALAQIFADVPYDLLEQRPLAFSCDCSWERTRQVLASLGAGEIAYLLEAKGSAEVECHYCHEVYEFNQFELELLLTELGGTA